MKLITVVSVMTRPAEYFYQFLLSLAKFKHRPVLIGYGEQYTGGNYKLKKLKQIVTRLQGTTEYILYTDCWDSLFVRSPEEIACEFAGFNTNVLVSGTSICHPLPELSNFFPNVGKNKFINTGGMIARPIDLLHLLNWLEVDQHSEGLDDQAIFSKAFIKDTSIFKIDSNCQIFQTLYNTNSDLEFKLGSGYYNKVTKTYPHIIHGDGRTSLEPILSNLRLLETSPLVEIY